jgi:CRP-like cAMP-binding protein
LHRNATVAPGARIGYHGGVLDTTTFPLPVPVRPGPAGDATLASLRCPALVLGGVILRMVVLGRRTSAQLLGAGDVLPGSADEPEPFAVISRVLRAGRIVPLDPITLQGAAGVPAIALELGDAVHRQAAGLMLQMAIARLTSIEERLQLLLPELAERWGVVTPQGVVLPAFFSHTVLSALIGVRRPSLTTALASLAEPGLLRRLPDRRWLLAPSLAQVSS